MSVRLLVCQLVLVSFFHISIRISSGQSPQYKLFQTYCLDCHNDSTQEAGVDLAAQLSKEQADHSLVFEKLITGRMPPADSAHPNQRERMEMLDWLAKKGKPRKPIGFRRISRHEFSHSVNDLLGTNYDVAGVLTEDKGTNRFDSNQRIRLTSESMRAYFVAADRILEHAFPQEGFFPEFDWITNKIKDSHPTYKIYTRPYKEGQIFSWTRANNGNSYSFFFDQFEPPVEGWYEFTFDAAKVGKFKEHVSVQVHAGKYYFADDRPQPQRIIGVISLESERVKPYAVRGFFRPGESVSIHCYSEHNWRNANPKTGAYIKQLRVRGPLQETWPPTSIQKNLDGIELDFPADRVVKKAAEGTQEFSKTRIKVIGASETDLKNVIRNFAGRAFAKELSDKDLEPYFSPAVKYFRREKDFVESAKIGFKSILCSHRFLFAVEPRRNDSENLAAALARSIWLSLPDQRLSGLAREGSLLEQGQNSEVVTNEIDRLLLDQKSKRMVHSICQQWLELERFSQVSPSLKLYPLYDDLLNHFMPMETELYLRHLIVNDLSVSKLVDSNFSFLNQRLAKHYGIENIVGQDMRKVSLPEDSLRGGLMTMGSILKVTTDGFESSPILRGAWISQNIAGNTLSPPPKISKLSNLTHPALGHSKSRSNYTRLTTPALPVTKALTPTDLHWKDLTRPADSEQGTKQSCHTKGHSCTVRKVILS